MYEFRADAPWARWACCVAIACTSASRTATAAWRWASFSAASCRWYASASAGREVEALAGGGAAIDDDDAGANVGVRAGRGVVGLGGAEGGVFMRGGGPGGFGLGFTGFSHFTSSVSSFQ